MTSLLGRPGPLLALLAALNVLNFVDRFLFQGFAVDLCADLHLSATQFTLLTGFVFTTFYTLFGLAMGVLADRVHRPRLVAAGVLAWTALTAATAGVASFTQLAAVRMFTGVGESTLTPAAMGLLADTQPPRRRALACGIYYLGSPIGIGGAFVVAGTLGAAIGWRGCFLALGAVGLAFAALAVCVAEPNPARAAAGGAPRSSARDLLAVLARTPGLALVIAAGVLVILAQGALVLDQLWLVQERGFAKAHAQNLSGAMFMAGGVLGTLAGGWGADRAEARARGGRLRFLAAAYAIGLPMAYVYRFAPPAGPLFLVAMFVGSVMLTLGYGPIFAAMQELAPARLRSTVVASMIVAMTLVGTSGGNLLVGVLADGLRAAGAAQPLTDAAAIGVLPWLFAIPLLLVAARRIARAPAIAGGALAEGRA